MEENEENMMQQGQQESQREQSSDKKKEMAKQVAEKATKKLASKGSLMAPLAHIIMIAAPILIAIIIIIGIIVFFITMPGMVMDQLKAKLKELANFVASFYGADTTEQIDNTEIYSMLDYLEQMGYDLKGFGFLTEYVTDLSQVDSDDYDDKDGAHLDADMGVIRNDDDSIIYAKSDFIFTYIVSDNYMYTLANDNIATIKNHNGSGSNTLLDKIINLGKGIATVWYKFRNAVWGPVFDALGITEGVIDKWGTGLIKLYYDTGTIGEKDKIVNQGSLWNLDSIKVNVSNNTLSIARGEFLNSNNPIEFSLDGWSGRYGMPMEFLLSVHIATMMPDLAYDMATSFPTNVNVYLHKTSEGEAVVYYKNKSGKYISYEELSQAVNNNNGHGVLNTIVNWFKKLTRLDQEILNAFALGIDHHEPCDCTFSEESFEDTTYYIENSDGTETIVVQGEDESYYTDITNPDTKVDDDVEIKSRTETVTMPSGIPTKPGTQCSAYVEKILSVEKWQDDPDYLAYVPYIHSVTNHWYRDVYFVEGDPTENNENIKQGGFVDYDYDYEALTGERWTLYETDANGDFVLYKADGTKFEGTMKEAQEQGVSVSKKPVKIEANEDTYDDLGWMDNGNGKWVAYEEDTEKKSVTGYQRLYTDADVEAETDENEKTIKGKLYVDVSFKGNVVQKGEGLRTETNSKIKKMFMENQYYKYDGTAETAEVITALRDKRATKGKYGALDETALSDSINVTIGSDGETSTTTHKASEVSGRVSLNQDSLNAFSMLENTHTLDADYIYRDFKELIVELGYFEKEELTDETPRLLQFIVPEISSGGFPNRTIDKNENEFGTMIHSEGDIKANDKNTFRAIIEKANNELTENPETSGETEPDSSTTSPEAKLKMNSETNIIGQYASLSTTPVNTLKTVGAIKNISDASYTFTPSGSSEKGTKTGDLEVDGVSYEVWKQTKSTCTLYAFAFIAQAYTGESPENYLKTSSGSFINATGEGQGSNEYWSGGFLGGSFEKVGITGKTYHPGDANLEEAVCTALEEGKPVYFYGCYKASADCHAVVLLGAYEGGVLHYDPGCGEIAVCKDGGSSFSDNLHYLLTQKFNHWLFIPDEAPTGVKKDNGSSYTGYKGNEAVVSPVTGILLDYGTYDGENDKSSITNELYRQNVDLKYQKNVEDPDNTTGAENNGNDGNNSVVNPEYDPSKPDLVGYAKILVLDSENYKKLEANSGTNWANNSLVSTKEVTNDSGDTIIKAHYKDDDAVNEEEKLEDLSEIEKTVYGYKEFAESYEAGGISGYVVYIDGFECYKPDEEFTEEQLETESPSKDSELQITLDSFKKITPSNIENVEDDDVMASLYEKDEEHKMASKKATEKLKATVAVKDAASSTMYVDNLIFIKEGTLLGRTITDFQLIEEYRGESYETYRTPKENSSGGTTSTTGTDDEEDTDAVIGNYLRIIFRDTDDSVVEDVETYMKLDEEGTSSHTEIDWEFYYWLPYESGGIGELSPGTRTGAAACGTVSGDDEIAVGFAQWTCLKNASWNNIPTLCEWLANENSSLCGSLSTFTSWSNAQCCDNLSTLQTAWWAVYDKDPEGFMDLQMKYFYEVQFKGWLEEKGTQWLENKAMVTQGTYASLMNWGPNLGWESVINESMSDEEICKALLKKACGINSTCGTLEKRWNSQYVLAKDILNNTFTEVEEWIKTKQPVKYEEGKNPGALGFIYNNNYIVAFNFLDKILGLI